MNKTNAVMVAILLVLGVMYVPQMIGSANAQSQQASENACPPGTTSFSQGECTVTTTTANLCPSDYTASGTGQGTCTGNICPTGTTYLGPMGPGANVARCQPTGSTGPPLIKVCPSGYTLNTATGICSGPACPPGSTLQGQSCVTTTTTRPGQGNQQ